MKRILIADDDEAIQELLAFHFKRANFEVTRAKDGEEGLNFIHEQEFDLLLLDIMMPVYSGIDLVKKLRSEENVTPILILTARQDDDLKLEGLGLGADDYLDKTTAMAEIIVRAEALIRRSQIYNQSQQTNQKEQAEALKPQDKEVFSQGQLEIDFSKKLVLLNGEDIHLTKREFDILNFLVKRKGQVVTRDELLNEFWGISNMEAETRTIDVLVGRLRKKLQSHYIKSKRGFGYYFDETNED